ncbi:MAG: alpha/beta hydrolase, partial [Hyphomicrobiales bacterium]
MMTRRMLGHTLLAGAVTALLPGTASAQDLPRARNVVLVHGLFA